MPWCSRAPRARKWMPKNQSPVISQSSKLLIIKISPKTWSSSRSNLTKKCCQTTLINEWASCNWRYSVLFALFSTSKVNTLWVELAGKQACVDLNTHALMIFCANPTKSGWMSFNCSSCVYGAAAANFWLFLEGPRKNVVKTRRLTGVVAKSSRHSFSTANHRAHPWLLHSDHHHDQLTSSKPKIL